MTQAGRPIVAYKGFDAQLQCRGFQFEVGKTYEHDGHVSLCRSGFHACEVPFDVWGYYPLGTSEYARVTLDGVTDQKEFDSKRVAKRITIEAKLSLLDLITAQVKWTTEHAEKEAITTGYRANAATTGEGANAATTGEGANAVTTGEGANAATTGYRANAATTGYRANAATTGYRANAVTTGKNAIAACLGLNGRAKAGENGVVIVAYWDETAERPRVLTGYVGEGIERDTWYEARDGKLVEVA